jgi:hypothetical protein
MHNLIEGLAQAVFEDMKKAGAATPARKDNEHEQPSDSHSSTEFYHRTENGLIR